MKAVNMKEKVSEGKIKPTRIIFSPKPSSLTYKIGSLKVRPARAEAMLIAERATFGF